MSLHDFNPNYRVPHVEAAYGNGGATDFDFEGICRRLDGETEPNEPIPDSTALDPVKAVQVLMAWVCDIRSKDARALQPIATRAIALAWVTSPALFGNKPARVVAEQYKLNHRKFSTHAAEFSRIFRVQNGFQIHDGKNPAQVKSLLKDAPPN